MKMAMGAVRTEDLAWLAEEAAKARPGERIVSLCHYPLNGDLTSRSELTATLRRLGIPLTLFGHYHRAPSLFNFDSVAGIQGRALSGGKQGTAGYTLLDFRGDSVRVSEKVLGSAPRVCFTIGMHDDPQVAAIASDPMPETPDYADHAQLMLQDSATIYTGVAFHDGMIYYGTTQGVLRAFDPRRGREVWQQRLGGALYTTPLAVEGIVIAGTTTRGLWRFRRPHGPRTVEDRAPRRRSSDRGSSQDAAATRPSTSVSATARWLKSPCATDVSSGVTTTGADNRRDSLHWPATAWFSAPGTAVSTASTPRRAHFAGHGPTDRKVYFWLRATSFPESPGAVCSSMHPIGPSRVSTWPRAVSYGAAGLTRPANSSGLERRPAVGFTSRQWTANCWLSTPRRIFSARCGLPRWGSATTTRHAP